METPEHLEHCETETIPGKSFVTRPEYPVEMLQAGQIKTPDFGRYNNPPGTCQQGSIGQVVDVLTKAQEADYRSQGLLVGGGWDNTTCVKSSRPLTYLACPYSDPSPAVMEWRYEQATKASAWLISKHELNVFSPITHSHPLHKLGGCKGDWKFWEKIDREYLGVSRSLMVLLLDGWDRSVGVVAEVGIAGEMGLVVEYLVPGMDGEYTITKYPKGYVAMKMPIAKAPPECAAGRQWTSVSDAIRDLDALGRICGGEDKMRTFDTGATRNTDTNKPDYEGFLSPLALEEFGKYMLSHQIQADGSRRDSDNWQKGIPRDAYMKSLWRHLMAVWMLHRGHTVPNDEQGRLVTLKTALSAILFNAQGYLHEVCKEKL